MFVSLPPALPVQDQAALFVDVSNEALPGIFTTCGSEKKEWILEVNGGGLALADFDGDNDLDLVVVDGSTMERVNAGERGFPPRLLLNDGAGHFEPAGDAWSMAGGRWGMGAAVGDVNGDGWPDLLITEWGPDRLFLNQAGAGFLEVTESAGLGGSAWSTSAAFLDANRDGKLDLYVARYLEFDPETIKPASSGDARWKGHRVMAGPEGLTPSADAFYLGNGDGTFELASDSSGLGKVKPGYGLGVMTLDVDADGDTDVYVANDSTPNQLLENQGDGTFIETGFSRGLAYDGGGREQAGMGIACAHLAGVEREALFVTNFSGESNAFYRSSPQRRAYRDRSSRYGLSGPSLMKLGWGTGFFDADLDGDLDLFVLNGHVYPQADRMGSDTRYAQADQLFLQSADGVFVEQRLHAGRAVVSRAGVAGDVDGDGDVDIIALPVEGRVRLLQNQARQKDLGAWLGVRLVGANGAEAMGATVTVEAGGLVQHRRSRTAGGFQAATPASLHFGLGKSVPPAKVTVRWPDGTTTLIRDVPCNAWLEVSKGSGSAAGGEK